MTAASRRREAAKGRAGSLRGALWRRRQACAWLLVKGSTIRARRVDEARGGAQGDVPWDAASWRPAQPACIRSLWYQTMRSTQLIDPC